MNDDHYGDRPVSLSADRPICIAVLAIGGQGGGVVSNWLVALAELQGWRAQSTSVPGVAQRTGATIYYIEIIQPDREKGEAILSLMPTPGDVDLVVAAEWMEAGRAMQRGLVSPERTTFIASTHRSLSLAEKMSPTDGTRDPEAVSVAAEATSKRFLKADLAQIADDAGSVISASLFGAIAASRALPFERDAFEAAIRAGGIGVEPSLKAFDLAHTAIESSDTETPVKSANHEIAPPQLKGGDSSQQAIYAKLCKSVEDDFSEAPRSMVMHGLNRVVDYHDASYGEQYLARLGQLHKLEREQGNSDELTTTLAKYLATAMAYQDVIRVADLKTRSVRFTKVKNQAGAKPVDIVKVTEFMHPRVEELCGLMPAKLGERVENNSGITRVMSWLCKGRRIRTDSLIGFLTLNSVAGLRKSRLKSLRHQRETAHIENWLATIERACSNNNYPLAIEVTKCQRLIKGYSDTHARGSSKYQRIMSVANQLLEEPDAAMRIRDLREVALADADDIELEKSLQLQGHE